MIKKVSEAYKKNLVLIIFGPLLKIIEAVFDFLKKKREEREQADINSTNTPNGNLSAQIANDYKTLGDAINNFASTGQTQNMTNDEYNILMDNIKPQINKTINS